MENNNSNKLLEALNVFASKKNIKSTVVDCLNNYKKKVLLHSAKLWSIKGFSKLKKADLISEILDKVLVKENLYTILSDATVAEISIVKELIEKKSITVTEADLVDLLKLSILGITHLYVCDNKFTLIMPDEIIEIIKTIDFKFIDKSTNQRYLVNNYLKAFTRIYGIVEIDFFVDTVNKYTNINLSIETLITYFNQCSDNIECAYLVEGLILHYHLLETEEALTYTVETMAYPFYKELDNDLLISYADDDFVEMTEYHTDFINFLNNIFNDSDKSKEILAEIVDMLSQVGMHVTLALEELIYTIFGEGSFEKLNAMDPNLKKFQAIIFDIYNNVRRWANKGFTNAELSKLNAPIIKEKTIGRNEPCPCGSGKKYKKCCLKV